LAEGVAKGADYSYWLLVISGGKGGKLKRRADDTGMGGNKNNFPGPLDKTKVNYYNISRYI
jgi:hypothetical protein